MRKLSAIASALLVLAGCALSEPPDDPAPQPTSADIEPVSKTTCRDVTSYDYNWENDMLCARPDGSKFYTSYEGAAQYE